ncbi:MAG: ABC transporter permease [Chloroflexota bacterium]|nr:ABC transporter permease [Chloroflexota bacterium]
MSRAASLRRATATQTGVELRLTARRGENLLAMIGIPAAVLLFFGSTAVLPAPGSGDRVDTLLPGTLALAIIATGLVNLGIATAYERSYGVLKRLGGSPLGRSGLIMAKVAAILVIEIGLVVALVGIAAGILGWRPSGPIAWLPLLAAIGLGTAAFAGLGLAIAGTLRPELTLVVANVLFLAVLAIGGVLVPVADLPEPLATFARVLPPAALTEAIRIALGGAGDGAGPLALLAAWAAAAVLLAVRTFRWD